MKKYPLIGASIIVVVLIVLGSFNNIVGYQTVQASNQKIIIYEVNEKDLLLQTIVDMANNKDIQRVVLDSQLIEKKFLNSDMKFPTFTFPVITEKFLKCIRSMDLILFKILSKSKIQSLINHHQVTSKQMQKELITIVERDTTLRNEMTQLLGLKCDCNEENNDLKPHPILCDLLFLLFLFGALVPGFALIIMVVVVAFIATILHCSWPPITPD